MSTTTLGLFLRHLALSEEVSRLGTTSDRILLAAYESGHSQAAFTELMRRHGPMVLRTCRRILGHGADAEDAFQATFIMLARKAGLLRRDERSLGGWLHRIAYQTALNVFRGGVRRGVHERQASVMTPPDHDPSAEATWNEIRPILDAELDSLPDEARRLLIAIYLEEKTYTEVAAELGLPRGSLVRHLERARGLLARRLARRGITVSSVLLAILLEDSAKGAAVPAVLLVHTVEAARTFTEQAVGVLSDNVVRLVKGGLAQMTKSWTHLSVALAGWVSLLGAGLIACQTLKAWPDQTPEGEPPATAEQSAHEGNMHARADLYGDPLPPGALARLGTARLRHWNWNCALVFTPDGKGLLTGGVNALPKLWDVATGKLIREFSNIPKPQRINGNYYGVSSAILSPDGRLLAVRSGQWGSLYLLETATGKRLHEFQCQTLPCEYRGLNFAFSPDSKTIAALLDGRLELRDVATGETLWQQNEKDIVSLAFSPDGKTLASAGKSSIARLWDARTGKQLQELGHKGLASHIVFSPDSRRLAVDSSESGKQRPWSSHLWDVVTDKEVRQLGEPGTQIGYSVFSPDGKIVATSGQRAIHLWDAATGKELRRCLNTGYGGPAAFSPDGKILAARDGPVVRFWDVASGKAMPSRLPTGHEHYVVSVAFTPDGQTLISTGQDHTLRWWDTRTGQQRLCLPCTGNRKQIWSYNPHAALSPDGTMLAVTYKDAPEGEMIKRSPTGIRLCDAATGKELRRLDGGSCPPGKLVMDKLVFSPDGKLLAQASELGDEPPLVVRLWDVVFGKRYEHELAGICPVFSPDSNFIATVEGTGEGTDIHFWEAATGKKINAVSTSDHQQRIKYLALSPDGQTLATVSNKIILYRLFWNKRSGVHLGSPRLVADYSSRPYPIVALAFSPDGRMLASAGGADKSTVQVWEAVSGKERARFEGHLDQGTVLAFSADSRRLASGSLDTTMLIWDITGRMRRDGKLRSARLSENELNVLWADLAGDDAVRAGRAIWNLVAAGPQAVSLLNERLHPAKVSPEVVRLIIDLDADDFKIRQKARHALEKLGEVCEPALREALAKKPSVEARRSLQELLSKLDETRKNPSGDVLRGVRAVEALEQVGTPDARRVLEGLSRGASGARLTREAQAAVRRLDRKQPG